MNEIAELVATASRVLAANGHDDLIWGHASVRDPDGGGAWLKTAEWSLGEVTADRVHLVDGTGTVRDGSPSPRHSEYPIHTEILAARPDVGAVVHTHPPHAVALAASGQSLQPVSHAATMFVPPEVPRFTDTADLVLTAELGKRVAEELGERNALFLVNHGIVTVGPDLPTAVVTAVVLERACAQQILTRSAGGWPSWSPPEEALAKREHIYHPTAIAAVWDHLVRELGR
ncbi:L-fuculose-phosphate aldolase [Actinomycetospora succinea]|uniref:L-fuculose-phosphate aldolase n=1 Tax=Actinomycetospora succinea TaxID=663603 RepID=A0A4R6VHX9_9PSEU|nr:class II aldolase/adducin family protein [Actinomycetospora succinea]TDQ62376.1 L-fuculose-phosphate aldolase [Actinomycetospora succinea]